MREKPQSPTLKMVFLREKAPAAATAPVAPAPRVKELTMFFRMKGLAIPMHFATVRKTVALAYWKFDPREKM